MGIRKGGFLLKFGFIGEGQRSLFSAKIKKAIIVASAISHPLRRKAKPKRTIIARRSAKNFKKGTGKNSGISVCFKLKFER